VLDRTTPCEPDVSLPYHGSQAQTLRFLVAVSTVLAVDSPCAPPAPRVYPCPATASRLPQGLCYGTPLRRPPHGGRRREVPPTMLWTPRSPSSPGHDHPDWGSKARGTAALKSSGSTEAILDRSRGRNQRSHSAARNDRERVVMRAPVVTRGDGSASRIPDASHARPQLRGRPVSVSLTAGCGGPACGRRLRPGWPCSPPAPPAPPSHRKRASRHRSCSQSVLCTRALSVGQSTFTAYATALAPKMAPASRESHPELF